MKGRMKVKNSGKALAGPFTGKGQGKASGDYSLGFGISKATPIVNQIIILRTQISTTSNLDEPKSRQSQISTTLNLDDPKSGQPRN